MLPEMLTRSLPLRGGACLTCGIEERLVLVPKPLSSMTESPLIVSLKKEHIADVCWVQPTVLSPGLKFGCVVLPGFGELG